MCVCTYVHTYVCNCVCMYVQGVCMCMCMYVQVCICTCMSGMPQHKIFLSHDTMSYVWNHKLQNHKSQITYIMFLFGQAFKNIYIMSKLMFRIFIFLLLFDKSLHHNDAAVCNYLSHGTKHFIWNFMSQHLVHHDYYGILNRDKYVRIISLSHRTKSKQKYHISDHKLK